MTFWQIIALVVVVVFGLAALAITLIVRRFFKKDIELRERKLQQDEELHKKEDENWRCVNPALEERIKFLEATCRENQRTIGGLKHEITRKDNFMAKMKVMDLYRLYENGEIH